MLSKKKNILILTSTFPRWEGDTDPPFVYELCKRLRINYLVHVLCPHAQGTKLKEVFNGIAVERFRYFFKRSQTLAYEGGILNRLKSNSWRYAIVPFFIIGELVATVRLLSNMKIDLINAHWLIPQ